MIAHVVGFISTGMFLTLRSLTDLPLDELLVLTASSVLAILAFLVSGFIFWSSKRGKFHMRDRVMAGPSCAATSRCWMWAAATACCSLVRRKN
ncbi:MAG: hypothetical protein H6656_02650 [Ardenticatenaceae bacterium]|nr:hypothetical protein [Ardenticatenaceae bacterium]